MTGKPTARNFNQLSKQEWEELYPRMTMLEIAQLLGCGETSVHKKLTEFAVKKSKQPRKPRTEEHKRALSQAHKGKTRPKNGVTKECLSCGIRFYVVRARGETANYCSVKCRAEGVQKKWTGERNPRFLSDQTRIKTCEGCGVEMVHKPPQPITSFLTQKFCTKVCADEHGLRYRGDENSLWKGDNARRRSRRGISNRWNIDVFKRDSFTCQRCGANANDVSLNAHHIRPVEFFPDERSSVANGITLCVGCHWDVHAELDLKFIVLPDEENPKQPAKKKTLKVSGKLIQKVQGNQTKRTWHGTCFWCGLAISKRLSDVTGKRSVFCSRSCASQHARAFGEYRPTDPSKIPSTARPPTNNDIE